MKDIMKNLIKFSNIQRSKISKSQRSFLMKISDNRVISILYWYFCIRKNNNMIISFRQCDNISYYINYTEIDFLNYQIILIFRYFSYSLIFNGQNH